MSLIISTFKRLLLSGGTDSPTTPPSVDAPDQWITGVDAQWITDVYAKWV